MGTVDAFLFGGGQDDVFEMECGKYLQLGWQTKHSRKMVTQPRWFLQPQHAAAATKESGA